MNLKQVAQALSPYRSVCFAISVPAHAQRVSDKDIVEAYQYMLGRWLVLRQETLDLKDGMKWNEVTHRDAGRRRLGQSQSRCRL